MSKGSPEILAIVTADNSLVSDGGATVFFAKDEEEQTQLAQELARALRADIIRLKNGCYVLLNT